METDNCPGNSSILHTVEKDLMDLDKILHNLEQDTNRQIQLIEKENIQSTALESRVEETEDKIRNLEEEISKFDEDTKAVHRQFRQNRESVDCLKKHYTVLVQHQEALSKRYQTLQDHWKQQTVEIERALLHYEEIWQNYKCKYESIPMAVELRKHKQEFEEIEGKLQATSDMNTELKNKLHALQYGDSSDETWTKCVVQLAKMKTEAYQVEKQIKQINDENSQLILEVKEEKERQNRLMQEYQTKKKIQEERANQLMIAQQQKMEQQAQSKQRELHENSTVTKVTVSPETIPQDQTTTIPQVQTVSQVPPIPRPVIPSKPLLTAASRPHLTRQPDKTKNQPLKIPQLEISSPSLLETTRNFQPRITQMPALALPQHMYPANLIQYKPRAALVPPRLPSLRLSTAAHHTNPQNENAQEELTSRNMYYQIPTLYQPLPTPCVDPVQVSQSLTPVSDTQVQVQTLPSGLEKHLDDQSLQNSLQGSHQQRPTQKDSAQLELSNVIQPSDVDVVLSRSSPSLPLQQTTENNDQSNQDLQMKSPSKTEANLHQYATLDATSQMTSHQHATLDATSQMTSHQHATLDATPQMTSHQHATLDATSRMTSHQHATLDATPQMTSHQHATLDATPQMTSHQHATLDATPQMTSHQHATLDDTSQMTSHQHATLDATSQMTSPGAELQMSPAGSQVIANNSSRTDHQVTTTSAISNTPINTYQLLLPDDGRSLFESHKASFEVNGNISPGFEFKRRPMFKEMQMGGEGPQQDQITGEPGTESNPFFQSFFQLGISGSRDLPVNVQQASNEAESQAPTPSHPQPQTSIGCSLFASPECLPSPTRMSGIFGEQQTSSFQSHTSESQTPTPTHPQPQTSTGCSLFASPEGLTSPNRMSGIFGEPQTSSFQSPTSLFGGDGNTIPQGRGQQTPGFVFAFGGDQDNNTDKQATGFSLMGTASPNAASTTEGAFSLF